MIKDREILILKRFQGRELTANEIIDSIYQDDVKRKKLRSGWRFYNHLNKRFAPLSKKNMIKNIGTKGGDTNRKEKVWKITKIGKSYIEKNYVKKAA